MNHSLKIPESYKNSVTVAIRGMSDDSDTVICTIDKKLMTFFNGYLVKKCDVEIEVKHLEPFVVYEPRFEVYYILHGDNKVIIVKEGTSFEIIKTYCNVYEMAVSDYNNCGTPQLYMRTDKGYECIDIFESIEQIDSQTNLNKLQETSTVYTFCANRLQQLQLLYDNEKHKIAQKTTIFSNAISQLLNDDVEMSLNIITKNAWLKLSNGNLVYGFTVQNTSKCLISNINLILLKDNKEIWSRFQYECWVVGKNRKAFDFFSSSENNCTSNIQKSCLRLNPESSVIIASAMDDWSMKPLPYFVNGLVYINSENYDIEDIVTLHCTTFLSCYQIKCFLCFKDMINCIANKFKFDIKHEWFLNSSLPWLRTIVCLLDQISPSEYLLKVFSDSLVCTNTFIQVISTIVPEHTHISCLNDKVPTNLNIDTIKLDLKELRRVLKENIIMDEQIVIPRDQWNNTRLNMISAVI